jgi:glycosyltransferase involved in cell wall biosynthesis
MSVHNDERFLREAVDSILAQTFADFELLAIDDGSADESGAILNSYRDPRVRIATNEANLGLTRSLNIGLDRATGEFIARMDADDVAERNRLQRQIDFLDVHPDVGLLGTGRTLIDESGNTIAAASATSGSLRVLWKMLLGNGFAHPTVVLRRSVLERHRLRYDESFTTAQDYELWVRMLAHTRGDNIPDPLVRYRVRGGSISGTRKSAQLANHDRIALQAMRTILPEFGIDDVAVRQLRGRFGGLSVRDESMDPADPYWLRVYSDMLDAFLTRHGQVATRSGEAITAVRLAA